MEVNIEKIMDDIRTEIKEKGYTTDMLSFTDVTGKSTFRGEGLDECDLVDNLDTLKEHSANANRIAEAVERTEKYIRK